MHVRHFTVDAAGLQEMELSRWLVQSIGPYVWHVDSKQSEAVDGKFNLQHSCKSINILFVYG